MYKNLLKLQGSLLEAVPWNRAEKGAPGSGFRTRGEGLSLATRLIHDAANNEAARHALASEPGYEDVGRLRPRDVAARLGDHFGRGAIRLGDARGGSFGLFQVAAQQHEKPESPQTIGGAGMEKEQQRKSWIRISVVDDESNRPISGVTLKVTLPGGSEVFRQSEPQGVMIDKIDAGTCNVTSSFYGVTRFETFSFVSMGKREGAPGGSSAGPRMSGVCIANIKEHKVKKGESILSLAKANGMQWQELAIFNWGTSEPNQINVHLREDVGCTKKTADGHNYMFDDSDDPGIMYIPRVWEEKGLKTEQEHVIRVRPSLGGTVLSFQMVDDDTQLLLPRHGYVVYNPQGQEIARGQTDDDAYGRARVPGPGEYTVTRDAGERFSLSGKAYDRAVQQALANAAITVRPEGEAAQTITSGGDGSISVADLPRGAVVFEHGGAEFALYLDGNVHDAIVFLSKGESGGGEAPTSGKTWEDSIPPQANDPAAADPAPEIDPKDF